MQLVQEQLEATALLEAENRGKDHDRDTDMADDDKSSVNADTQDVQEKLAKMDCA